MFKFVFVPSLFAALGLIAGCSSNAAEEQDLGADESAASSENGFLIGTYINTDGQRSGAGALHRLELKADKTFVAARVVTPADHIVCITAPCTLPFSGRWSVTGNGDGLTLRGDGQEVHRYELVRAQDGGPIQFVERATGVSFPMKKDAIAPTAQLTTGTFKLFADPQQTSGSCVLYTQMAVSRGFAGYTAHLENRVGNFGTEAACRLAVDPMPRDYVLSYASTSCGSTIWTGSNGAGSIEITDHATRLCRDLPPSKLIVTETTSAGAKTLYAAEPVETFEGTLTRTVGIGGENTGVSLNIGNDAVELVLNDGQRNQVVEGRYAKVTGVRTTLSGVETSSRPAIRATQLLVCPAAGTAVNCMPGPNVRLSNLCAPENLTFLETKCGARVSH